MNLSDFLSPGEIKEVKKWLKDKSFLYTFDFGGKATPQTGKRLSEAVDEEIQMALDRLKELEEEGENDPN